MPDTDDLLSRSLDALDDVFYVYDADGRLVFWNDRINDTFGLTDEQVEGMTPVEFFVSSDRPTVERAVARIFDTGETVTEARAETTRGVRQFELTGRKLTDEEGDVLGFCGIGRDVTDRRERERQLAAQNDRLRDFATILAHDLRNPLSVAQGYLDHYHTNGAADDLDHVTRSLDRIERIVEDVLTVAIEGQTVTGVRPVGLDVVARDAWAMVEADDATLDVETTLIVDADESRLRRLFENLFRNCVEHGSTGSRTQSDDAVEHGSTSNRAGSDGTTETRSVTVSIRETDDGFAVDDDGPGIDPADRDRVFDPGVTRDREGTGFGLYIVQTIAEAHGWTVAATESPSGGARFAFTLAPRAGVDTETQA